MKWGIVLRSGEKLCHFKVLGVTPAVSNEALKKRFLELSKVHHPDMNVNDQEGANEKYLTILEAYKTLSNPTTRRTYENSIGNVSQFQAKGQSTYGPSGYRASTYTTNQHGDPEFYEHSNANPGTFESPYKYFSNKTIVFLLVGWMVAGITYHYFTFKSARKEIEISLRQQTLAAGTAVRDAEQRARTNGYRKQLELLKEKAATEKNMRPKKLMPAADDS